MTKWIAAYLASAAVYATADLLWMTQVVPRIYRPVLQPILADQPRLAPAIVFYLLYVAGIVVFAVAPGLKAGDWVRSLLWGALLGLLAYGTYDLTNHATLKVWSTGLTVLDMAWGAAVTALAAGAGCLVALLLVKR